MAGTIRNIIFDVGNVLVRVDYEKFENGLLSEGLSRAALKEVFSSERLKSGFESGEITAEEFLASVICELKYKITPEQFIPHFNSMFSEIPQMKIFLTGLHREGRYTLLLLSNTNPIHFAHFKESFDYVNLFHHIALSYELKMLKPDIRIFNRVMQLYDLNPENTLFIDDLEENCAAAARTGMNVIKYRSFDGFLEDINKYNISIDN